MEGINKALRILVCIMLSMMLFIGLWWVLLTYSTCGLEVFSFNSYLGILFIIYSLILYFFIKNKSSKVQYNVILLFLGILIIFVKYRRYITDIYTHDTLIQYIFSLSSIFYDIIPLSFVYLSAICTYFVNRNQR